MRRRIPASERGNRTGSESRSAPIEPIRVRRSTGLGAFPTPAECHDTVVEAGRGSIIEEHDNTPGLRKHDHRIDCDTCHAEWQLVDRLPTREWRLEPLRAAQILLYDEGLPRAAGVPRRRIAVATVVVFLD